MDAWPPSLTKLTKLLAYLHTSERANVRRVVKMNAYISSKIHYYNIGGWC
jgi:hypothetical protein